MASTASCERVVDGVKVAIEPRHLLSQVEWDARWTPGELAVVASTGVSA
ncbi:hypothetical protein AB0P17_29715 [Streptomyces sp. NPDC088124]